MWMGKEGMGILFSLNFSQIEKVFPKTGIAAGATSNSFLLSGVEPKNGIDIKMHQPGSAFPLLTDFFLISVFYG